MAPATAIGHFFQLLTTTQPESMSRIMSRHDSTSGFLNRINFAYGNPKYRPPIPDPNAESADIDACVPLFQGIKAWAGVVGGRKIGWTGPAAAKFTWIVDGEIKMLRMQEDSYLLQRADLMFKKLCLLMAINERMTVVTEEHVEMAKSILDWMVLGYGETKDNVVPTNIIAEAMQILQEVLETDPGNWYSLRDVKRCRRRLDAIGKEDPKAIHEALRFLESQGEIQVMSTPSGRGKKYCYPQTVQV
jgi:hypothetical protein